MFVSSRLAFRARNADRLKLNQPIVSVFFFRWSTRVFSRSFALRIFRDIVSRRFARKCRGPWSRDTSRCVLKSRVTPTLYIIHMTVLGHRALLFLPQSVRVSVQQLPRNFRLVPLPLLLFNCRLKLLERHSRNNLPACRKEKREEKDLRESGGQTR